MGGKIKIFLIGLWFFLLLGGGDAFCFHGGGVAPCEACHTIHNSYEGMTTTQNALPSGQANAYLLLDGSPSSVCLNCHESGVSVEHSVSSEGSVLQAGLPPVQMAPGGDFAWLKKTYSWNSGGMLLTEEGERHGHNIVSTEYGYVPDAFNLQAPGGTYPSDSLHCTSCHDPHGGFRVQADSSISSSGPPISQSGSYSTATGDAANPVAGKSSVGTYRLLAGAGYRPSPSLPAFAADSPAAISPLDYNRPESITQTRVAYGSDMSEWCRNCHGGMGHPGEAFVHPAGNTAALGDTIASHYNSYVKTGDLSGLASESYLSLVPFEIGLGNNSADRDAMAAVARTDDSALDGPGAGARVSCLTCHRAHASGWNHMLRWNHQSSFLVYNGVYPGTDNGTPEEYSMGRTEAETRRAYYDRPSSEFAENQNTLCEKCHP